MSRDQKSLEMTLDFRSSCSTYEKLCPIQYIMGRNPTVFSKACRFFMLASVSVHVRTHVCVCACVCERERRFERRKSLYFSWERQLECFESGVLWGHTSFMGVVAWVQILWEDSILPLPRGSCDSRGLAALAQATSHPSVWIRSSSGYSDVTRESHSNQPG